VSQHFLTVSRWKPIISSLDIPANNCAVLQRGDDLELLGAGQHYITNPNVTLRGMYTCGENQIEMPTKDMCVDSCFFFSVILNLIFLQLHS